jgi:HTH-type transcriptional regulator / antitoxin HigA
MATDPRPAWAPDWAVPPGEILLEALQDRGMTQSELARRMARPLKTINEIINGKAAITSETAIQLERTLGISARFWTGAEASYRDSLAQQQAQRDLEANATWIDDFPVADLLRHGQLQRSSSKAETLANLLSYLGVSSPVAFDRQWLGSAASFRSSPTFLASPKAVAAWLRWGEREAAKADLPAFDARRFRVVLREIRPLTRREPFMQIFNRVRAMCAEAGVVIVLVPELTGTHLSGAARWLGNKAVIQLSLRHKSDDQFWFTFFHEAGHLLSGSRRQDFLDAAEREKSQTHDADEEAADRFARNLLLPPEDYDPFVQASDFSTTAVRSFAERQAVAPGIVVGRLQRDGLITPGQLRHLKKPIHFPSDR